MILPLCCFCFLILVFLLFPHQFLLLFPLSLLRSLPLFGGESVLLFCPSCFCASLFSSSVVPSVLSAPLTLSSSFSTSPPPGFSSSVSFLSSAPSFPPGPSFAPWFSAPSTSWSSLPSSASSSVPHSSDFRPVSSSSSVSSPSLDFAAYQANVLGLLAEYQRVRIFLLIFPLIFLTFTLTFVLTSLLTHLAFSLPSHLLFLRSSCLRLLRQLLLLLLRFCPLLPLPLPLLLRFLPSLCCFSFLCASGGFGSFYSSSSFGSASLSPSGVSPLAFFLSLFSARFFGFSCGVFAGCSGVCGGGGCCGFGSSGCILGLGSFLSFAPLSPLRLLLLSLLLLRLLLFLHPLLVFLFLPARSFLGPCGFFWVCLG